MFWMLKSKDCMLIADNYQELLLYAERNNIRHFNLVKKKGL